MEKESRERDGGVSRIIGATPEEEIDALEYERSLFKDQSGKEVTIGEKKFRMEDVEREKTPEEREIIAGILAKMPEFVKQCGGTPVNLSEDHIHIIDRGKLDEETQRQLKESRMMGMQDTNQAAIFIFSCDNIVLFASGVTHEVIHFNSFISEDKIKGEKRLVNRRYGLAIPIRKNIKNLYFNEINEAVTEKLAMLFGEKYFCEIPSVAREIDHTTIENYTSARNKIDGFIDALYEKNKDNLPSKEAVFNLFVGGYFTGNILPLARLVEKTYGKGSFRRAGELSKK
jgi:hypothetical protein